MSSVAEIPFPPSFQALGGHVTTAAGSVSAFTCGLYALAVDPTNGPGLAVAGTLGGILVPVLVAWVNRVTSRDVAAARAERDELRAELGRAEERHRRDQAALFDRLTELIGERASLAPGPDAT